jgi:CSLREA domain-containing protein
VLALGPQSHTNSRLSFFLGGRFLLFCREVTVIRSLRRLFGFMAATRSGRRPHFVPRLTILEDRTVLSPLLVTTAADEVNPNDGVLSLREAIAQANTDASNPINPQSDTIVFAASLGRATITLDPTLGQLELSGVPPSGTSATETINGRGLITVSGNDVTRVFQVDAGVTGMFEGLAITHGKADGNAPGIASYGGGILNFGNLTLSEVVVSDNQAIGDKNANPSGRGPGFAAGGGVYNQGNLTVEDNSIFTRNQALGNGPDNPTSTNTRFPGTAIGGGIDNEGVATVKDSQFTSNLAQGGNSWQGVLSGGFAGVGGGGAIASVGISFHAELVVSVSSFSGNQAIGGDNNSSASLPGFGVGGAIFSHRFSKGADLNISGSTFDHNQAIGGNGNTRTSTTGFPPNIADGGGIFIDGTLDLPVMISGSTFDHNQAIGGQGPEPDGNGGLGQGGGIAIGFARTIVILRHCTVEHNQAIGGQAGPGGTGGEAHGGGIFNHAGAKLTVEDNSIIDHNQALGGNADTSGPASNGGSGQGGGVWNELGTTINVTASSISYNLAIGASGSNGGNGGDGLGGGFYNAGTATVTDSSITHNHAIGGDGGNGGDGLGGGLYNAGTANLIDSIIAFNHASGGDAHGGGIFKAGGTLTIDALTEIFGNHPDDVAP